MSTSVSIGIHAEPRARTAAVQGLVARLLARSEPRESSWYARDSERVPRRFPGEQVRDWLDNVVDRVWESSGRIEAEFLFQSTLGQYVPLLLALRGDEFAGGRTLHESGSISLLFDVKDVLPELPKSLKRQGRDVFFAEFAAHTELSAREVFSVACGVDVAGESNNIQHAAMYRSGVWPAPARCGMVYHRDATEFLRDLERIYVERSLGVQTLLTFDRASAIMSIRSPTSLQEEVAGAYQQASVRWLEPDQLRSLLPIEGIAPDALDSAIAVAADECRRESAGVLQRKFHMTLDEGGLLDMLQEYENPEILTCNRGRGVLTNPMGHLMCFYDRLAMTLANIR